MVYRDFNEWRAVGRLLGLEFQHIESADTYVLWYASRVVGAWDGTLGFITLACVTGPGMKVSLRNERAA